MVENNCFECKYFVKKDNPKKHACTNTERIHNSMKVPKDKTELVFASSSANGGQDLIKNCKFFEKES